MATKNPKIDQLKVLRSELRQTRSEVLHVGTKVHQLEDKFKEFETDLYDFRKEVKKSFEVQNQRFFDWKSELFDKIDEFMKPVRDLQEESSTMNVRITRLEKKNPLN